MLPVFRHHLLLLTVAAVVFLPNLGAPSLWDIDEGNNAEAAREMLRSGNWIVPTFNYELRVDKPALLYWLQVAAYSTFGVTEFAARLPSALAAMLGVVLVYELGRRLFDTTTGLVAGLVLATAPAFCAAARFANPDALLTACTLLSFLCFWHVYERPSSRGFAALGAAMGLAVLAKGPVGLVLPSAVAVLFLLWTKQLRRLLDLRLGWWLWCFLLVVAPWYAWVAAETKAEFLRGFLMTHNVGRYLQPMEGHGGPFWYYGLVLVVGLLPWSIFLGQTIWHSGRRLWRWNETSDRHAFLSCWVLVYLVFFTLGATKLPNYVLPAYPAAALLVAAFLEAWRTARAEVPGWTLRASVAAMLLLGVCTTAGVLIGSGVVAVPRLQGRVIPEIAGWALLGLVPVAGALLAWVMLVRQRRDLFVATVAGAAAVFVGVAGAWGGIAVENRKAPRALAEVFHAEGTSQREVRVAAFDYFQPSLVYYCRREVGRLQKKTEAIDFLRSPLPAYLFIPARVWEEQVRPQLTIPCRELARRIDLYRGLEVVIVTNH